MMYPTGLHIHVYVHGYMKTVHDYMYMYIAICTLLYVHVHVHVFLLYFDMQLRSLKASQAANAMHPQSKVLCSVN